MEISSKWAKAPTMILFGLIFLLPMIVLPYVPISFVFTKASLVFFASAVLFLMFAVESLKTGKFSLPRSWALLGGGLLILIYLLSSIFSDSMMTSLIGYGFESETFFAISMLVLLMFSVATIFKTKDNIFYAYIAFFLSFAVVALYQLVRIFAPTDFLSFGLLVGKTSNLVGKWSDLGILSGLVLLISIISLEFVKLDKLFKVFLYCSAVLSLFFLALINLTAIWVVIGLISLLILIFGLSERYSSSAGVKSKFSFRSLIIIMVSILFLIGGTSIQDYISSSLGIGNIESRPSWQSTVMVAKESIQKNPIFGAGPNRFSTEWLLNKPVAVNDTLFWDTDFSFGIGFVPTTAVTVGPIGFILWLLFLAAISYEGFKVVTSSHADNFWRFLTLSSFAAVLYLWVLCVVYPPNMVILSLAFIFTGVMLAGGVATGAIKDMVLDFSKNAKVSFLSVFSLVILSVVVLSAGYIEAENVVAHVNLERGLRLVNTKGDLDGGERLMSRSAGLVKKDLYFRALEEMGILRMNNLVNRNDLSDDVLRSEFQNVLTYTIENSKKAIAYDETNYQNWVALGRVYEAITPLGVSGAYEESLKMYNEALSRNPNNPSLYLFMARLEAGKGNTEKAKEYIAKSLSIKNNYTEAIFLLSQIQVSEGKLKEAIASVESASIISPNDSTIFFQLGLLRYNNKDYKGAIGALERSVILNPIYSNAKYFLGLSYEKQDRVEEAIAQFEDIKTLNPDNEEVKLILSNLRAGKSPFAEAKPPVDEKPEGRDKLPIEE